jgi:ubiquinone/menaquinone biosynthesis C-methylase UbiE
MEQGEHKDYFSSQANVYAAFRPTYPTAIYEFIFRHLRGKRIAWDCATGNGQVAHYLANHVEKVFATDISQQQLDQAIRMKNIFYSLSPAEKTSFPDHQFDLITVAQALHWFERDRFYEEVKRVSKPGALLAVWGYALLYIEPAIDNIIMNFYNNIVGPYWDHARRLVEEEYRSITFPFKEIASPKFFITTTWTLAHLAGYLESWSATQKYIKAHGVNPVPELLKELGALWEPETTKAIRFPVFLRLGELN